MARNGFRLKLSKCKLMMTSVVYLWHRIDREGIHKEPSKMKAILNAPTPKTESELRSFLGMLNYYGNFIPHLSTLLKPLNSLLQADSKWIWTKQCCEVFNQAKSKLPFSNVPTHYDTTVPISMAADASAYGLGAVISHIFPDGSECPIAFTSHTLSPNESNSAHIEKVALALTIGVKMFHQYLYGRKFTHRPQAAHHNSQSKQGYPNTCYCKIADMGPSFVSL